MSNEFDPSNSGSDSKESYLLAADFFHYLSNPMVLMILKSIRRKEMTSYEIAGRLGLSHQEVAIKLRVMVRKGILASWDQSGKTAFRVTDSNVAGALDRILEFPQKRLARIAASAKSAVTGNGNGHKPPSVDTPK